MSKDKKQQQLGMNPSTANGRLVKDILWSLIVETGKDFCYVCNEKMCRDTFSIEHKIPWLDTDDPIGNFFDLENISFSHLSCNVKRVERKLAPCGTKSSYQRGCRCDDCIQSNRDSQQKYYTPENRRNRYLNTGN